MTNPLPVWLDCDPGHDDMMAIIMSATHPSLALKGISATHGNQSVDKTYVNGLRTVFMTGKNIPVYKGYAMPLIRESRACPEIHGESGLGGIDWTDYDKQLIPEKIKGIPECFAHLRREIETFYTQTGKKFTVITTASFTNICQFLMQNPDMADKIHLVSMAGNFKTIGNILSWSEFNVLIDPEACAYIMKLGIHIAFIPLDVTHTVLFTPDVQQRVEELPNKKLSKLIVNLLTFYAKTYKEVFKFDYPPLHDPVAVYYILHPEHFCVEEVHVDIETKGELTYGACCADWYGLTGKPKNATVCLKVDVDKFWVEMVEAVKRCHGGVK